MAIGMELMQLTLQELPALVELIGEGWSADEMCKSFEDVVLAYVCFEGNPVEKLREAKVSRDTIVSGATAATDCEKILFDEEEAHNVCVSWFGGTVVTDFQRFQELVQHSSLAVRTAYLLELSSSQSSVTETKLMRMRMAELREVYRTVWQSAEVQAKGQAQLGISYSQVTTANGTGTMANGTAAQIQNSKRMQTEVQPGDIQLSCRVCDKPFLFTVRQQAVNKERGYDNQPTKCDEHRTPGQCDQFRRTGNCAYGDGCKFQHVQDTENAEVNNVKTRFDLLLPGQTGTVCSFFEKGTCQKGDRCPFVHPGNEKKQEAMSLVMEKERTQTVVHGRVGLPLAIKNF